MLIVRGLIKLFTFILLTFSAQTCFAETFKVVIIPDNIVSESVAIDSFIYNASAEFFADEVANILNTTDYIYSPSVSEIRALYKQNPSNYITAKDLAYRYKTSYNVDYAKLKKLAAVSNARYVLLITSYIDAENYILRRTVWDFLNIAGATVVDPAYKVSIYAALVDTETGNKIWSDTFYKTISVCENRIITRGYSPQTEQLQKIKDYSRLLCPEIALNVQQTILPPEIYEKESKKVYYDINNIDNVFTKKYRRLNKEYGKIETEVKKNTKIKLDATNKKIKETNEDLKKFIQEKKEAINQSRKEVKATPLYSSDNINNISDKKSAQTNSVKNAVFYKPQKPCSDCYTEPTETFDFKKKKKNNLISNPNSDAPELRDYYLD